MEEQNSPLRCQKAGAYGYIQVSIGKTGFHLAGVVSSWNLESGVLEKEIRAELILQGKNAVDHFNTLGTSKPEIESELGEPLTWYDPEQTMQRRIYLKKNVDYGDESSWPEQHAWMKEKLEK